MHIFESLVVPFFQEMDSKLTVVWCSLIHILESATSWGSFPPCIWSYVTAEAAMIWLYVHFPLFNAYRESEYLVLQKKCSIPYDLNFTENDVLIQRVVQMTQIILHIYTWIWLLTEIDVQIQRVGQIMQIDAHAMPATIQVTWTASYHHVHVYLPQNMSEIFMFIFQEYVRFDCKLSILSQIDTLTFCFLDRGIFENSSCDAFLLHPCCDCPFPGLG
jgi:hypothetical protein